VGDTNRLFPVILTHRRYAKMTKAPDTLAEAIELVREGRTLVEDEYGYLRMKKDLTYWERVRLFFKKWGSLISIVISIIALTVSILK
jgi:hypothetical protein